MQSHRRQMRDKAQAKAGEDKDDWIRQRQFARDDHEDRDGGEQENDCFGLLHFVRWIGLTAFCSGGLPPPKLKKSGPLNRMAMSSENIARADLDFTVRCE